MKRMLFTPAAAAKPLLNRVRRILKKRESDRTCGWLAGLTLFLTLTLTPLALALFNSDEDKPKNKQPLATLSYDLGVSVPAETDAAKAAPKPDAALSPATSAHAPAGQTTQSNAPLKSGTTDGGYGSVPFQNYYQQPSQPSNNGSQMPVIHRKPATGKPTGPISSKLYPYSDMLKLFSLGEFLTYLQNRLGMEMLDDPYQIFPTQKDTIIVTGTENVHEIMGKIMNDLKSTIEENKEVLEERETIIKVIPLQHAEATLMLRTISPIVMYEGKVMMTFDVRTNSLLVRGNFLDLKDVEALVKKLDMEATKEKESGSQNYYR